MITETTKVKSYFITNIFCEVYMKQKDQRSSKKEQEDKVQVNQTDEPSDKKLTIR